MSENSGQQPMLEQKPCVKGCGFFGSASTSYMCSKCWRDAAAQQPIEKEADLKKEPVPAPSIAPTSGTSAAEGKEESKAQEMSLSPPEAVPAVPATSPEAAAMASEPAAAEAVAEPGSAQTNRKRCFICSKKVGYTGIECRCKFVFCGVHRYPEQHNCTFDYKTADRAHLETIVTGGGQFSKLDRC